METSIACMTQAYEEGCYAKMSDASIAQILALQGRVSMYATVFCANPQELLEVYAGDRRTYPVLTNLLARLMIEQ